MVVFESRSDTVPATRRFDISATKRQALIPHPPLLRNAELLRRKVCRLVLAFSWLTGLLAGFAFYSPAGHILDPWMCGRAFAPVSIRPLLCVTLLPFLFSAFAVFISRPWLIYPLAFSKAFLLGLIGLAVQRCWGSAGWLARWMLCFSSAASGPLLYWYWLRHIDGRQGYAFSETALVFSSAAILGSMNFFVIVPLAVRLIYS